MMMGTSYWCFIMVAIFLAILGPWVVAMANNQLDPDSSKKNPLDEKVHLVRLRFELSREPAVCNFQWRVVSTMTDDSRSDRDPIVSSCKKEDTKDEKAELHDVFLVDLSLMEELSSYSVILHCAEDESTKVHEDPFPVFVNVTLFSDHENMIIFSKHNLRLDSTTYEIPFSIETSTDVNASRLLKASGYKEFLEFPPVRGIGDPGDDERPPPPTHRPTTEPAPKPTPAPAPKPPTPGPTPKPVPQPTPSPDEGGGGESTPAPAATPSDSMEPTTFSAIKPSFNSGNTSAPSISHAPSLSPTIEPPCTSTTREPIPYDDKYIAIKLHVTDSQVGGMSQNATDTFLTALVESYNAIAACEQKGAFRRLDQAFVDRVTQVLSGSDVEWIVRLTGVCEGCIMSAESLFSAENDTTTLNSAYESPLNNTPANGTILTGKPCFCPGPLISVFQDNLNQLFQYNTTETTTILNVVELEDYESCESALLPQDEFAPEQHDTLVALVTPYDPSEITEDDLKSMINSFIQVVHSHLSLTYPTCDLSRKRILDIQPDPNNPIIGRNLNRPRPSSFKNNHRLLQQTSADFELVLKVTFTCFGCDGRLFGRTNFTPNHDCLCPKDADHFGVDEKEILLALNQALDKLSIEFVSDVIEIEQVPCSSTVHEFSTVAVIEYILQFNGAIPTDGDLALLEDVFVVGYNGMARRYCDPHFRRITSATTIDNYKISNDGLKVNVEMSILGTCRATDIQIYDSNAFFARLDIRDIANVSSTTTSAYQGNRNLQTEPDGRCYCSVTASKELGPSEPEIVTNFGNLVDQLTLESVLDVATCRAMTFRTGFFVTVPAKLAHATQDELNQIGQTFVDTYNQQSQQEGLCDEYFRKIIAFRVDGNPTLNSTFNVRALVKGEIPSDRMILARKLFQPTRRVQDTESVSPSMAPTLQPSILGKNDTFSPFLPFPGVGNASLFVEVSGRCQGCSVSIGLFDQVSARRRYRQADENEIDDNNTLDKPVTTSGNFSCFCPPESTRLELSAEAVTQALSSLSFVNGTVSLQEVEIVECSVEVNTFETTTPMDFLVNGGIVADDESFIASGFMTTYTDLSEVYCDSLFRRLQEIKTRYEITSGPDQNGVSTVRFWLDLQGTCRGCTGLETLFDSNRRRMQMQEQQEEVCFCNKDAFQRAPTDEEFQEAFAKYLGSGRRLQQNSKFVLLCVGSTCPDLPVGLLPSMSPTIINLVNPFGIQNYDGCVVPFPSFVGDGFCDRAMDSNQLPIYNTVECGYDGGDCCESTCQGFRFECGSGGYWCIEDQAVNNAIATTCADQVGTLLGDGVCDLELNIPFCAYDEGDCCESTCGQLHGIVCIGYFPTCVDPNAVENAPSASPTLMPSSTPSQFPSFAPTWAPSLAPSDAPTISPTQAPSFAPTTYLTKACKTCGISDSAFCGDGYCDDALNNAFCGWDGGDCCKETCVSTVFTCPTNVTEYVCRDPEFNGLPASCRVGHPEWVGDGVCDVYGQYNVAGCNFDGGDCCENTCVKQSGGDCQYFYCLERLPEACAAHFRLSAYPTIGDIFLPPWWVGDGYCDYMYNYPQDNPFNTAECLWDMGDCCGDTCKSSDYICGLDSPFYCIDPNSPFHTDLNLPEPPVGCNVPDPEWLGDGWCDYDSYGYNTAACGWDLGDCCGQTCSDATWFQPYDCGVDGYTCLDPRFPHPPDVSSACQVTSPQLLGDGLCDSGLPNYNSAACGWDLGDCCPQTCLAAQSQWYHKWECGDGGYECLDPDVPKPPDVPTDCAVSTPSFLGNGYCDRGEYNTAKCLWDFGDCCNQTCHSATWYHRDVDCGINGYECLDPSVPKPPSFPSGCNVRVPAFLGDGKCDSAEYNTEECGWDLGDCCEQTCLAAKAEGYHQYECGSRGYNCSDTTKPPVPELCDAPDQSKLGNGWCDYDGEYNYNTQACGWDLGDCCAQTCFASSWYQTSPCGVNGYNCLDPSVDQGPTKPTIPMGCSVEFPDFLGDGRCDDGAYNTDACNWDFGDCCKKSCEMAEWFQGYSCGSFGYNCSDPHRASWDYVNVVSIDNTLPYASWSGGYRSASDYLFGAPVYYDGFMMLYWCKEEGRWTIQRDGDIAKIAANGCKGQGFMSVPQTNAASICDAIWKDTRGAVVVWICGETCPPCSEASLADHGQSISMSLGPTSVPSFLPSEFPSKMPAMLPSNFPSEAPSKLPVTLMLPSEFPSEFPTEFPSEFLSEFPTEGPKDL